MKKLVLFLLLAPFIGQSQTELTLEDAVVQQYGKFYPESLQGFMWIKGTNDYSFYSNDYQTLSSRNSRMNSTNALITASEMSTATGTNFRYAKIIAWKDSVNFYTSNEGWYFLINIATKKAEKILEIPSEASNEELHIGTGNVACTENGIRIMSPEGKFKKVIEDENGFVNGQAIARSEFGITNGLFWSNSGNYLGFYRKDESKVADYPLLDITTPTGSLNAIKYPMAGQESEISGAGIFNLKTLKTVFIQPKGNPDDYITNFGWSPDDKYVFIAEVNRDQNHMKLQQYNAETGQYVNTLFEEKNEKWVEPEHAPYFLNNERFIWLSERDGFMNLYLYNINGKLEKQLTANKWVAQEIIGHDSEGNVYFMGTGESPLESHCFKVNIASGKQEKLTKEAGTHRVVLSDDYTYMFDSFSAFDTPNVDQIVDVKKGKIVQGITNAKNPLADLKIGKAEYGTIKAADNETDLHYRLIKPSDFDENKKYPVLVYVYGGPHAQMITNSWYGGASLWMYWMAEQGYLVYTLDNRGSANRGFAFESVIHRNLGDAEMADQMKGVEFLKSKKFVDPKRLAVHGWSFGGFMTTSLMLRYPGEFTTGVAGGPVTDWAYYEVMYGERYMDRPEENEEGYKKARLMNYADKLTGNLLLIHGTIDDVVVMQHNLALVKSFIDAGVQMDFFPYPMHPHNVRGKDRIHLMRKVLTYVIKNNL